MLFEVSLILLSVFFGGDIISEYQDVPKTQDQPVELSDGIDDPAGPWA